MSQVPLGGLAVSNVLKANSDMLVNGVDYAGTGVSTAAAATVDAQSGQVTTESLTTAHGSTYSFVLTNKYIKATSTVLVSVGTAGTGEPCVLSVVPTTGSATILIKNVAASDAFNAIFTINFFVLN
jgi:hypothetical protein